jgi:hypothetical protein
MVLGVNSCVNAGKPVDSRAEKLKSKNNVRFMAGQEYQSRSH